MANGRPAVRTDDRQWRYQELGCARCGSSVQVAKSSPQHTSVQWTQESVLRCAEFAAQVAASHPSALVPTCASLRASIDAALADGRLVVSEP